MNITYLFGAGASKEAIPIVKELNDSMKAEMNALEEHFKNLSDKDFIDIKIPVITKWLIKNFLVDFNWLITESEKHQSVDTLAKKLYLQHKLSDLKKLKTILSIYFILVQSRKKADQRYDSFFASILEENWQFPPNLKILSWNYDYQFEKAFGEYYEDYRFESCNTKLNIVSKNAGFFSSVNNGFNILKLNGTASFILDINNRKRHNYLEKVNQQYNNLLIYYCLERYTYLLHNDKTKDILVPSLSFAWEDDYNEDSIITKAIKYINNTDVLVVIGYSFPLFNRSIDRRIIRSMNYLNKVYFQAPDAETLKERFLAIRDDIKNENLVVRKDVEQFAFPNEF